MASSCGIRRHSVRRRSAVTGYALLAPSLFGVVCFLLLPVLQKLTRDSDGIVAAGSTSSAHPAETKRVLAWLGSAKGSSFIGASGSASPAVLAAQQDYADFWAAKNVDISPFYDVLANGTAPAPEGSGWPAADNAMRPLLQEVFLGRTPVAEGVRAAQDAANAAVAK